MAAFETLLADLADRVERDPAVRVGDLRLAGADERRRVVEEWNRTDRPFPRQACVHELFEARAREHPDAVALAWGARS
jgi:non-ribosomal peptide synthetase component F